MINLMSDVRIFIASAFRTVKIQDIDSKPLICEDGDTMIKGRTSLMKVIKTSVENSLTSSMTEYGPPYQYDDYYKGALLYECSQQCARSLVVHRLLNSKVDPNDIDQEELNFTPLHWCARHCHLNPTKMLVQAKAHINALNEFGQSPLVLCTMMKQTLNKISTQLAIVEFLLDSGAHISIVDKGGLSPLDYAVLNENILLIQLLLDYGATVRRDNKYFVIQRSSLLDNVQDKKCYHRIKDKLNIELAIEENKLLKIQAIRKERDRIAARKQFQLEKKERRMEALEKTRTQKTQNEMIQKRIAKVSNKLNAEKAEVEELLHSRGAWEKSIVDDENISHWVWQGNKSLQLINSSYGSTISKGLKSPEEVHSLS